MLRKNRKMKLVSAWVMAFAMALLVTGCSWQGTSADRGGDLHNGSPADWNNGTGKPDTGRRRSRSW